MILNSNSEVKNCDGAAVPHQDFASFHFTRIHAFFEDDMPIWNPLCLTLLWTSWLTPGGHWGGDLISVFFLVWFRTTNQNKKHKQTHKQPTQPQNENQLACNKIRLQFGVLFLRFFFDGSCCMSRAINSMYAERPNLKSVSVYSPNKKRSHQWQALYWW